MHRLRWGAILHGTVVMEIVRDPTAYLLAERAPALLGPPGRGRFTMRATCFVMASSGCRGRGLQQPGESGAVRSAVRAGSDEARAAAARGRASGVRSRRATTRWSRTTTRARLRPTTCAAARVSCGSLPTAAAPP